jgi:hypothetical protein
LFPESVEDLGGLDFNDISAAASLKYLRSRSMRNPRWRDADSLGGYIQSGGSGRWSFGSPLQSYLAGCERALATYRQAKKRADPDTMDASWAEVCASVDRLLDAADRTAGRTIRPDLR